VANSNYVLPAPETVTMSGDAARRLIGCGSGDAALLYLHILASGGRLDLNEAALRTGRTQQQLEAALNVLRRLSLVNAGAEPEAPVLAQRPDELPQYTREDILHELQNGEEFPRLVSDCQRALGKVLNSDELMRLFGIYDYLGMPPEVILQLIGHCKEEVAHKNGNDRPPTMRYIEKAAFTWEKEGLLSLEAAEAYLQDLHRRRGLYYHFSQAMNLGGRQLSNTEKEYVDSWSEMGFTPEAAVIACDRTLLNTGKLAWKYMDSILKSWHQKGLHTPNEINAGDPAYKPRAGEKAGAKKPDSAKKTPVSDRGTTQQDMDRMRKTLERITGGKND